MIVVIGADPLITTVPPFGSNILQIVSTELDPMFADSLKLADNLSGQFWWLSKIQRALVTSLGRAFAFDYSLIVKFTFVQPLSDTINKIIMTKMTILSI